MTRRLTDRELGRAMRLAGVGFGPAEIVEAVGCSFGQAQKIVRERNRRLKGSNPLWFDRGELPPPEVRRLPHHDQRQHSRRAVHDNPHS